MIDLTLSGTYGSYNLFLFEGRHYAVYRDIPEKYAIDVIREKKALTGNSSEDLIGKIRDTESWANTRGMYGLHDEYETRENILRANSFNTYEKTISKNYSTPIRLKTKQGIFVVEASDIGLPKTSAGSVIDLRRNSQISLVNATSVDANPELIFQYGEYNIVEYDKEYYGIPRESGPLDLQEINLSEIPGLISGSLTKEVMQKIDQLLVEETPIEETPIEQTEERKIDQPALCAKFPHSISARSLARSLLRPLMKFQWYQNFRKALARLNLVRINVSDEPGVVIFGSGKRGVRDKPRVTGSKWETEFQKLIEFEPPKLIEALTNHKIISFKGYFFLVGRDVGEIALSSLTDQKLFAFPHSRKLSDIKNDLLNEPKTGSVVAKKTHGGYNIFLFEGVYFAVPEGADEFDFINDDIADREDIKYDIVLNALEVLIDDENSPSGKEK